jgi:hypothetical protein
MVDEAAEAAESIAVHTLTTHARALGTKLLDTAVGALSTAWDLASSTADQDLMTLVRDELRRLPTSRRTIRRVWTAVADSGFPA